MNDTAAPGERAPLPPVTPDVIRTARTGPAVTAEGKPLIPPFVPGQAPPRWRVPFPPPRTHEQPRAAPDAQAPARAEPGPAAAAPAPWDAAPGGATDMSEPWAAAPADADLSEPWASAQADADVPAPWESTPADAGPGPGRTVPPAPADAPEPWDAAWDALQMPPTSPAAAPTGAVHDVPPPEAVPPRESFPGPAWLYHEPSAPAAPVEEEPWPWEAPWTATDDNAHAEPAPPQEAAGTPPWSAADSPDAPHRDAVAPEQASAGAGQEGEAEARAGWDPSQLWDDEPGPAATGAHAAQPEPRAAHGGDTTADRVAARLETLAGDVRTRGLAALGSTHDADELSRLLAGVIAGFLARESGLG